MNFTINYQDFDTIVIGSGGSGLMAAVSLIKNGAKNIAVISKVFPTSSHTVAAKGGINAALGNFDGDDPKWHAYDTMKSSDYLADEDSVNYMCENAPKAIIDLEKMGLVFSRFKNGKIYQRPYGGQTKDFGKGGLAHRACPAKDNTGHSILNTLYQKALENNVRFFNEFFLSDLIIQNNECLGAVTIDLNEGEICVFKAKNVIIATGGGSQIYKNSTTSNICTGDGGAAVLRSKLPLQDMEFVQFHPTGLYGCNILVTEAARGEGAYLLNGRGERFMEKYNPELIDLAPRDQIARAITLEIEEGRGAGENKDYVYLKIDHLGEDVIKEKLPGLLNLVKSFAKIDALKEMIPVVPVAHYSMGGIPTNSNCEVVSGKNDEVVSNLYAIGEAACVSVHGANRMGCNSLLDLVVFGDLVGKNIAQNNNKRVDFTNFDKEVNKKITRIEEILQKEPKAVRKIGEIRLDLQENMQKYASIYRNHEMLATGLNNIVDLVKEFKDVGLNNKSLFFNDELIGYFELENLLLQALATIYSAIQRVESRGAHQREDFAVKDDNNWLCHSLASLDLENLSFDFNKRSVRLC